jgi:hypothetical protein
LDGARVAGSIGEEVTGDAVIGESLIGVEVGIPVGVLVVIS